MRLTQITPPTADAITLEEVKDYLQVDHDDQDALLTSLIGAVSSYLDGPAGILGRAILSQMWRLELASWPDRVALPVEPVSSVSVSWLDADGDESTLSPSSYQLVTAPGAQPVIEWERDLTLPQLGVQMYPVRVEITAGAADAASVEAGLKTAMIMLAAHWFEHRSVVVPQASTEIPLAISALLSRYRRHL